MKTEYTWLTRCFVDVLDFRKYLGNDMSGKSLTKLAENIGRVTFFFYLATFLCSQEKYRRLF